MIKIINENMKKIIIGIIAVVILGYFIGNGIMKHIEKRQLENVHIENCRFEKLDNKDENGNDYIFYIDIKNDNSKEYEINKLTVFSDYDYNYVNCEDESGKRDEPIVILGNSKKQVVVKIPATYISSAGSVAFSVGSSTDGMDVYKVNVNK